MSCPTRDQTDFAAYLLEPAAPEWEAFRAHQPECAECTEELEEWMHVEALLHETRAPAEGSLHPAIDPLLAFRDEPDRLTSAERDTIAAHVGACAICRDAIRAMPDARVDVAPIQRTRRGAPLRPRRVFGRRVSVAALAAAALLAVLIPGWLLWSGAFLGSPAPQEPIASVPLEPRAPLEAATNEVAEPGSLASVPAEEPLGAPSGELRAEPDAAIAATATPSRPKPEPAREAAPQRQPATDIAVAPTPAPARGEPTPDAAPAQASDAERLREEREILLAALIESPQPRYVAPAHAVPFARLGGGSRAAGPHLPNVLALAPEHAGLTLSRAPDLYWFVSAESRVAGEFVLTHPDHVEPVVELPIRAPIAAGIHVVRLSELGITLETGTVYRWFISLIPDPNRRAGDRIARGVVQRIEPDVRLRSALAEAEPASLGNLYAQEGLFYDALAFTSHWIEDVPDEPRLRERRAGLLEQVGLPEAAEHDRVAARGTNR